MKKGDSLLVHAGTGGVGQASINIALHMGVDVFTTVGSPAKKEFLLKKFPGVSVIRQYYKIICLKLNRKLHYTVNNQITFIVKCD